MFYYRFSGVCLSIFFLFLATAISVPESSIAQQGEELFNRTCTACHTIGKGRLVGPDLKGVNERLSEKWLVPWIKNSQAILDAGDEYANKLFEEYNKIPMPPPGLSDDEITAVLAYIKTESESASEKPAEVVATGDGDEAQGGTNILLYVLLAVAVFLVILLNVLGGIKKIIQRVHADKKGLPHPPEIGFFESIRLWMAGHKRWVALMIIILIAFGARATWYWMLNIGVAQGYEPDQPIWFSHKIHAGDNAINCIYCHSGAEKSKTAGVPAANICMNCHKYIREGTQTGAKEIAKIYEAVDFDPENQSYGENTKPIRWIKVHNLPDLAYFNHSQHVKVGGIQCQECHGAVEEMDVMRQQSLLTMGWCVECHRNTEVKMEGNPYYNELHAKMAEKYKGEKITVDKIGGLDCARCHY